MAELLTFHDYQESTVQRVIANWRLGLFLDPGLGKTAIILEAFRRMRETLDVNRLLVVAPLRPCYSVWPAEIQKWANFHGMRSHILHDLGKDRLALAQNADVWIINPNGLEWLADQAGAWWRLPTAPDMLAVDESTKFKRASTQRSRHLKKLLPRFPRRYILTGTPAANSLEDLHGQGLILDETGVLWDESLENFRIDHGFVPVPDGRYGHKWRPSSRTEGLLNKSLSGMVVRLKAEDHLDLPELLQIDIPVRLPPKARELYEEFRREMVLEVEAGDIVAVNGGVLTNKCRQIANGAVYVTEAGDFLSSEDGRHVEKRFEVVHTAKAEALCDLSEQLGGRPLLVAYEFKHDLAVIQKVAKRELGFVPPHIGGGVRPAACARIEAEWNAGELRMLLLQFTGAHGMNLQKGGSHVAWYGLPWDPELYDQLYKRIYRQGQKADRVIVYHIMAENTADQVVAAGMRRKMRDQDSLMELLKRSLT